MAILLLLLGLTCAQLTWVIISHLRGRGRTKAETYSPCVNWAVCPSPKLLQGTCGLCWRLKSPLGQQSELQPQLGFSPIMESVKTWGGRYCSDHYNGGFCQTHVENQGALRWKSLEEGRAWESAPLEPGARKKWEETVMLGMDAGHYLTLFQLSCYRIVKKKKKALSLTSVVTQNPSNSPRDASDLKKRQRWHQCKGSSAEIWPSAGQGSWGRRGAIRLLEAAAAESRINSQQSGVSRSAGQPALRWWKEFKKKWPTW